MKKNRLSFSTFLKASSLALIALSISSPSFAQTTAASASWSLDTDSLATVTGNVTAPGQGIGSFLVGTLYGSSFDGASNLRWKRHGTSSSLPVDYNANSYVEYAIAPTSTNYFQLRSFSFSALGGGTGTVRAAVYYSVNNFATSDSLTLLQPAAYNALTYRATQTDPLVLLNTSTTGLAGKEVVNFTNLAVNVLPGQTLKLRVYVWITAAGTRYFPSKLVTISGVTSPNLLPLNIAAFSATQKPEFVSLDWATSNEVNVESFTIERATEQKEFTAIGSVKANGGVANKYSFADLNQPSGTSYYRLKMIDNDGTVKYSNIVSVVKKAVLKALSVASNPFTTKLVVSHAEATKGAVINLVSIEGKTLSSTVVGTGAIQTSIDASKVLPGNYMLVFVNGPQRNILHVLKQ